MPSASSIRCQSKNILKKQEMFNHNWNWNAASTVNRAFVKFPNPKSSPAKYWLSAPNNCSLKLSVIIPTFDAYRDGYFPELIRQIKKQNVLNFELIVVRGDPRQGRAINVGASMAQGKYILTLDDDTYLPDAETFGTLINVMESNPDIGIAGGNNIVPSEASIFEQRVMKEIPRRSWSPVKNITDSDFAEHPCMIFRTEEFKAVGGENELIPRGLDPYLREQFRKIGKRVVIVPGVFYSHMPPKSLPKLLRQFFRNGRNAAFTNLNYPQWVIETPSGHGPFNARRPLSIRLLRFPFRIMKALIQRKFFLLLGEIAYATGFAYELSSRKYSV
jgi:glycosyltransferase involved in cell wall biosynthesis